MDTGESPATAIAQHRHHIWAVAAAAGVLAGVLLIRQRDAGTTRWYRVVYRTLYRLGLIVWQRPTPPPIWLRWSKDPRRWHQGVPWIWAAEPAPTPSTWPPTAGR